MNRVFVRFVWLIVLVCAVDSGVGAEPFRGIELDPEAPESVVKAFADSGINAVVISFRRQADLSDPDFIKAVKRWGKLSSRYKLRCHVAIRLFGPPDYTGAKGGYRTAVEMIAASPCVCPTDRRYWAEVVTPRVRRIAELAKEHGLAGALLDYQATLSGLEYDTLMCCCDGCWRAFVEAKGGGDESLGKLRIGGRRNWVRSSGRGVEYFSFLSTIVEEEMSKAAAAGRAVFPQMTLGVYGYLDAWFYEGVVRALAKGPGRPPTVMAEREWNSFGQVCRLMGPEWKKARLDFLPIARLPLNYYLPRDVQNQIAELDGQKQGFLLTRTESLWRRVRDVFHVAPPNGSADGFAAAVREGLAGRRTEQSTFFNKPHYARFTPRMGLLHGKGLSALFSHTMQKVSGALQSRPVRLDARQPGRWLDALSIFDVIIVLPGAGAANAKGLTEAGAPFARFLRNGGMLIVLGASDGKQLDWLASAVPTLQAKAETRPGVKQGWLANETGLLASPCYIKQFAPLMWRFQSFADQYIPLAKDGDGQAYLLMQHVGRGLVLVSAGPVIPPELLANAWFHLRRRGDLFNVQLLPGADEVFFGQNKLVLGAAEASETAGNVDLCVDVINTDGEATTRRLSGVSLAGDGVDVPLTYEASAEGAGRVIVTISDPADGMLLRRFFIPLLHDQRVEILPDKNYYTDEAQAVLRFVYRDKALRPARVEVTVGGKLLQPNLTGGEVRFADIPISDLKPGQHELRVSFHKGNKSLYATALTIRKERPFARPVKILHHRNCVLEVKGKPFFPFGCYGIGSDREAELVPLGVNTTIHGSPGEGTRLWTAGSALRGLARDADCTPDALREKLGGDEYAMLLGWYMFDEPALNSHSPEHVLAVYRAGQAKDPYHPQLSVYIGSRTYPLYPDYAEAADCHMMDHYPLPFEGPATFGIYLARLGEAIRGRRNLWAVPQSFDWRDTGVGMGEFNPNTLHPTGAEALNYIYQSIVEGAGAITFWTYRYVASDPRRHKGFLEALEEGAKLTRLVTEGTVIQSPRVKPLSAQIRCRSFQIGKQIHIVAVNRTERTATVTFSAPYLRENRLRETIPVQRRLDQPIDTFAPLQGKVYVVDVP